MPVIRPGEAEDLQVLAVLQAESPEAAQWNVAEYLSYDLRVAVCDGSLAGFCVSRTAAGETELLNLVVAAAFRRRGIARALLEPLIHVPDVTVYLEVRESNRAAREFYKSLGFQEVGRRPQYYGEPSETAIVMKFHSC